MNPLEQLHEDLKAFCVDSTPEKKPAPGFAIHKDLILDMYRKSLARVSKIIFFDSAISPQSLIDDHETSFDVSIDTTTLSIELLDNGPTKQEVHIKDLSLLFRIYIDKKEISTTTFTYKNVFGYFSLVGQKLKLIPQTRIPVTTSIGPSADRDQVLNDCGITTSQDKQKLEIREQGVVFVASESIIATLIKNVEFPNFFEMLKGIKFAENGIVGFSKTGDHFFFSALGELNLNQCPTHRSSGELTTKSKVSSPKNGKPIVNVEVTQNPDYPDRWDEMLKTLEISTTAENDLYVYIPKPALTIPFNSVLKPAINLSDEGNILLIYWYWSLTASVNNINISVAPARRIPTILLDAPVSVYGQAGAGIEIACITFEVAGAKFRGKVDPLQIEFTMALDFATSSIVFVSRISNIRGKDFAFDLDALGFPIDDIAEALLSDIAEDAIVNQAEKILNVTRITLADFSLFKHAHSLVNNFAYHQDHDCNLTAGVKFKR